MDFDENTKFGVGREKVGMRWSVFLSAMVMAVLGSAAMPARGGQLGLDSSDFGPEGTWNHYCEVDRMTDAASCRLYIYRIYENGAGADYMAVSIVPIGKDFSVFLSTSEGLVDGCAVRVDRLNRVESRLASVNMCVFAEGAGTQVVEQFKTGTSALVRASFLRSGRRDLDFPLKGFARSFEDMQRALQVARR
jgi:hypothetical protein